MFISGDRRVIKDDQYFIDESTVIWDCVVEEDKQQQKLREIPEADEDNQTEEVATLVKEGMHEFHFSFRLPKKNIPCSLESRESFDSYSLYKVKSMTPCPSLLLCEVSPKSYPGCPGQR